jgi:hypothetical protein
VTGNQQRETGNAFFVLCDKATRHTAQLLQQLNEGEKMLSTKTNQIEIAVRLYDNQAYGTTHGKGMYRSAIYNGTIDAKAPAVKYLVDLCNYDYWTNQARTDEQMVILDAIADVKDKLYSWIQRYDPVTRQKTLVQGVCTLDLKNLNMDVLICDEDVHVVDRWQITAKPCKQSSAGLKSPQLLATNADLAVW